MRIKRRKVQEIKQKLVCTVKKRVFIANELHTTDVDVDFVEKTDGVKPLLVIRIKRLIK